MTRLGPSRHKLAMRLNSLNDRDEDGDDLGEGNDTGPNLSQAEERHILEMIRFRQEQQCATYDPDPDDFNAPIPDSWTDS